MPGGGGLTSAQRRALAAGIVGNVLEWYDFALYGFLAPVLGKLFFPSEDPLASLVATFGVFAAGYLMRPIGGLLIGPLGDRVGRKKALTLSVYLMAIPTALLGLLPTYAQAGVLASILLTVLRMLQGISVGGEFTGSISFLAEHAPPGRRGYFTSWVTVGAVGGILLGSAAGALLTRVLSPEEVAAWGWRIPFLAGILVGATGGYLRRHLEEAESFRALQAAGTLAEAPLRETLRNHGGDVLRVVGMVFGFAVTFYMLFVYMTTYLSTEAHLLLSMSLEINTTSMLVILVLTPPFGLASDRFGRKGVLYFGLGGIGLLALPGFILIQRGDAGVDLAVQVVFAVFMAAIQGAMPSLLAEVFPTRLRMSGISLAYNAGQALFGGTTPLVSTWLIEATGSSLAPSWYLAAACAVTCGVLAASRTAPRAG